MCKNKLASIRYRILDKCFKNPVKKYFIDDLINACNIALAEIDPKSMGVSRRTILYDITHMESAEGWNAIIERVPNGKRTYYRYQDRNFSIDNQPLNQAELEQIKAAMKVLGHFKGLPQFEWLSELSPKMENALLLEKNNAPIISFDTNQYLTGIEYLSELFYAILYKKPLCITYKSYKKTEATKQLLHPYHLKQYNNRWFLFGLNHKYNTIVNLALDRIKSIEEEPIAYQETEINFEEYFDDIIGVSLLDGKVKEKIILKFFSSSAPYVLSKPLHHSQKRISYNNEELTISIEVIPNYELESLIFSFGEQVEILEPKILKHKIILRLKQSLDQYLKYF